jgi:LysM repeat protein
MCQAIKQVEAAGDRFRICPQEGCCFLRCRKFPLFFLVLVLLLVLPAVSLWAAEGTAHLTFRKAVLSKDNERIYIIRSGDTIARIVRKLGWPATRRYKEIKQLNPHIPNLNRIYPGQKILLPPTEQQEEATGDAPGVINHTAQKGDSLTRIIISELRAGPAELAKILGLIKQMNPEVTNLNKIYPGQVIKFTRGGEAGGDSGQLPHSTPAEGAKDEKVLAMKATATEKYLPIIRHVIEQLNGKVITNGNLYIPLPESGQVSIDCATIPVVELGDGTTILLDFAGRLPDALASIIQVHWKNYHIVKFTGGQDIASVLQKIILSSPSFQMVKVETPLSFDDLPQVKLSLDWLITRKSAAGSAFSQLGLIFAADKSQLLPSPAIFKYALKKGIRICEILGDKVQAGAPDTAEIPPLPQIKGGSNDELLYNFLVYLGLGPLPNREVKIFESRKDGFDLAIKAEYMMQMGGKAILITKNKLPQQFSERLKQEGMTSFSPAPGATKISILQGVLAALDIPSQFAIFSLPPPQEKTRVNVSFPALQIVGEKGSTYLIDYEIGKEIYELLTGHWKLNMMRY